MSGMVVGLLAVVVLAMFAIIRPSYTEMLFFRSYRKDNPGHGVLSVPRHCLSLGKSREVCCLSGFYSV
jgi:hypothetical protein